MSLAQIIVVTSLVMQLQVLSEPEHLRPPEHEHEFSRHSRSAWDLPPNPTQADVASAAAAAAATAATYQPSRAARRGLQTSGYIR